jgi:anti-sigma regulatory factor (Ser/Thr protein kinase)
MSQEDSGMETSVTFPGLPAMVPSARRFVSGILAGTPYAGDMELIAAELASNAIRHSPAGRDGGEFTVTVHMQERWARVEVSDTGTGQWYPPEGGDPDAEYGRGLAIVAALADKFGHDITADGQTMWAETGWDHAVGQD